MGILSKDALLGASDLVEREVDLRPHIDGSVRIRSLPAAYSNEASSASLEMVTDPKSGRQTAKTNIGLLERLQVKHGLIDPQLESDEEVALFSRRCGAAWHLIVREINEISGIDEEAVKRTEDLFRAGGSETSRVSGDAPAAANGAGSDIPVSARP